MVLQRIFCITAPWPSPRKHREQCSQNLQRPLYALFHSSCPTRKPHAGYQPGTCGVLGHMLLPIPTMALSCSLSWKGRPQGDANRLERGELKGVPTSPHDRNREGAKAEQGPSLEMHGWPHQSQVQGASHAITGFVVGLVRREWLSLSSPYPSSSHNVILSVISK
jgi:hypothetical protein